MNLFKENELDTLTLEEIKDSVHQLILEKKPKHVLIVPPDFTRFHSNAGLITNLIYHELKDSATIDILPALGTHVPLTEEQKDAMFLDIPFENFLVHDWRNDVIKIGEIPHKYIEEITDGLWSEDVDVMINKRIMDPSYDLILSIGQVVPHEVVGMANHAKNLFVGCGGKKMIDASHIIGAIYGMERLMGKDHSPVRKIFDYALNHFLNTRPITFILTVTTNEDNILRTHGLYISESRDGFEKAVLLSQKKNINILEEPLKKCIVYLNPEEFKTTWLGNKAIYRTRMAIADQGELLILAPGIIRFGEDLGVDAFIRKYGYRGRLHTLDLLKESKELRDNMSVAAHLIHGSSDDRFHISYAVKNISLEEIDSVGFQALSYDEVIKKYNPETLKAGINIVDGEEVYFIPNPALGLWIWKEKLN